MLECQPACACRAALQENATRLPDGLVFVADRQLGGKGGRQEGREWWAILCLLAWHGTAWRAWHGMAGRHVVCTMAPCPHGCSHSSLPFQSHLSNGAGRGGNRWESPGGCLMFTAVKRLAIPGQRLPFVQYIVSLAVAQAVQAEAAARLQVRSGAGFACTCWHGHDHGTAWAWRGMPSNANAMPPHVMA